MFDIYISMTMELREVVLVTYVALWNIWWDTALPQILSPCLKQVWINLTRRHVKFRDLIINTYLSLYLGNHMLMGGMPCYPPLRVDEKNQVGDKSHNIANMRGKWWLVRCNERKRIVIIPYFYWTCFLMEETSICNDYVLV